MKTPILIAGAVLVLGPAGWYDLTPSQIETAAPEGDALVAITLPDSLSEQAQIGKRGFDAVCAACHGENAMGRNGMARRWSTRSKNPRTMAR